MFSVKKLAHHYNTAGVQLRTFEVSYPRTIHAELMTHRLFSRNAASSRAIPISKMIGDIVADPYVPEFWGKNQSGMQAGEDISSDLQDIARSKILEHLHASVRLVSELQELGLHKQLCNRYLEPWMFITIILTTSSLEHFKRLRVHEAAEPHFRKIAAMICESDVATPPVFLPTGSWHLPLVGLHPDDFDFSIEDQIKLSTGRCARVSYMTHDGKREPEKDIALHDTLSTNGHWSPFEHQCQSKGNTVNYGNIRGYLPYRKTFPTEFVPDEVYRGPCTTLV